MDGVRVRFPRKTLWQLPLYAALAACGMHYAAMHPDLPQRALAALEEAAPRPAETLEDVVAHEAPEPEFELSLNPLADGEYLLVGAFDPSKRFLRENVENLRARDYDVLTEEGPEGLVRIALDLETLSEEQIEDVTAYLAERDSSGMIVSKRNGSLSDWTDISTKVNDIYDAFVVSDGTFPYQDLVEDAVRSIHGSDADFAARVRLYGAIMAQESSYDPQADSPKGARGLMQVMPHMADDIQEKLLGREPVEGFIDDPASNVLAGVALFKDGNEYWARRLRKEWDDPEVLKFSLAEYNAGRKAAIAYHRSDVTWEETADYVPKVFAHLAQISR